MHGTGGGNGGVRQLALSGNGRRIMFSSSATDLVSGASGADRVYVCDLETGTITDRELQPGWRGRPDISSCVSTPATAGSCASTPGHPTSRGNRRATDLTADPTGGHVQVFRARIAAPP